MRHHLSLAALVLVPLGSAVLLSAGCPNEPYFTGDGPPISGITPDWENGNVGGALVLPLLVDRQSPTEEEMTNLVTPRLVRIGGDFSLCDAPRVVFGNRNATIWAKGDDGIDVLTPVGPVRGGAVDVQVACIGTDEDGNPAEGVSRVAAGYDYYLGDVREDGTRPPEDERRRMEPLFANEYGSFTLFYQAEPFASMPDATGYGFFFSEQSPRSSMFYGQNPDLVYGGATAEQEEPLAIVAQVPQLNYETPEQGDRLEAGEAITFFFQRNHGDALDPVRVDANKTVDPNTGGPAIDSPTAPNNIGAWLRFVVETAGGGSREHYLRIGQDIGRWCQTPTNAGCGGAEDERLNNTRVPIDPSFRWVYPDRPTREHFEQDYPGVAPEYLAHLDCADDETCEAAVGVMLPSGTYRDVQIVKAADEEGEWPWQDGEGRQGFRATMEEIPEVVVTQGARFVDLPRDVQTRWRFNEDQTRYDNFDLPIGEGGFPMDTPIYVSYPGGFSQGERIPPKNYDAAETPPFAYPRDEEGRIDVPQPGTEAFDETPYIEIPPVDIDTMLFAGGGVFAQLGFPVLLPLDDEGFDWRVPLPGGALGEGLDMTDGGRWEDTYFVVSLSVRQIEGPGGFGGGPWKVAAFAWPGDDYVIIPRESLMSVPIMADAFRPTGESQNGEALLGFASLEVHRLARWNLSTPEQIAQGRGFRAPDAKVMFDVNAISVGYFHTENSCVDGIDNDGDGQIDASDTNCARADDEVYESGGCQDGEDNDDDELIDGEDPDCLDQNGDYDPTDLDEGSACADNQDNDGDGWTDYRDLDGDGEPDVGSDPGCTDSADSSEGGFDATWDCNDGMDSDGDRLVDADDPGCDKADDASEAGDTCSDGLDNNADGWTDAEDLMCRPGRNSAATSFLQDTRGETVYEWFAAVDFECSNSLPGGSAPIDDDGDGLANELDPQCAYGWDPSGEATAAGTCIDLLDNDGDGWFDDGDPSCITVNHPENDSIAGGTCNDGLDNEGDGWMDALDPVCALAAGNETIVTGTLQYSTQGCNNNVDDDGDGDTDSDDPECFSGRDNNESE